MHISQMMKAPPDIWSYVNARDLKIQLTRQRSSWYSGKLLLPKTSDQEFFFPISFSLSRHATPKYYIRSLWLFCLALAFTDCWPLERVLIQPTNDYWAYHDTGDPVALPITNFSLISSALFLLELTLCPLYHIRPSKPGSLFPCLWLTTSNLGKLLSRLHKEETQDKGNQNKITCTVYRPLNFTGLHRCHFFSHKL